MKVQIVAYKERIVVVPSEPEKDITTEHSKMWWPSGGPKGHLLGCVLGNTVEQLGISDEAYELMKSIQRNHDAVGDISWWEADDGLYFFSWWGSIHRIINPDTAEGDRDFRVSPSFRKASIVIPNVVPEEAQRVIDSEEDPTAWREPHRLLFTDEGRIINEENP